VCDEVIARISRGTFPTLLRPFFCFLWQYMHCSWEHVYISQLSCVKIY